MPILTLACGDDGGCRVASASVQDSDKGSVLLAVGTISPATLVVRVVRALVFRRRICRIFEL